MTMKNNKERIVCVSEAVSVKKYIKCKNKYKDSYFSKTVARGCHTFYYQPANSAKRFYLFSTKHYSPSIAAAFSESGVLVSESEFTQIHSITLNEFYRLKTRRHNYALNKIFERIPVWIDDVIRYEAAVPEIIIPEKCNEGCFTDICYRNKEYGT